jgi:hypothetical protein
MRSSLTPRRLARNAFAAVGVTVAPNIPVAVASPPLLDLESRIGTSGMDLARNPADCSGTQPPHAFERFLAKYVDDIHGPLLSGSGNFNIVRAFRYALTKHLCDGVDIICTNFERWPWRERVAITFARKFIGIDFTAVCVGLPEARGGYAILLTSEFVDDARRASSHFEYLRSRRITPFTECEVW